MRAPLDLFRSLLAAGCTISAAVRRGRILQAALVGPKHILTDDLDAEMREMGKAWRAILEEWMTDSSDLTMDCPDHVVFRGHRNGLKATWPDARKPEGKRGKVFKLPLDRAVRRALKRVGVAS